MSLSERYSRQELFEGIGKEGQQKLSSSTVLIVGCGALGSLQIETLARAGVGKLKIVDRDFVEASNLQRQVMYDEQDATLQLPKAIAAAERVKKINSSIEIEPFVTDLSYKNVETLAESVDLVLDATDNFETRYLINDTCVKHFKPWIYGAAVASQGLSMTIIPEKTPCLRCVFETAPPPGSSPTCDTSGVIFPIIAMVVALQTTEAIKLLLGRTDLLHQKLVQIDPWQTSFTKLNLAGLRERTDCRCCKQKRFDYLEPEQKQLSSTLCGRNSVQISPAEHTKLSLAELADRLKSIGEVSFNRFLLRFKTTNCEMTIFPDARTIIHNTKDENLARSLYARYVGV
ncbi:MAG: ThiF family adenylyltransferase [Blastocatellia bacterium]|nr:ThiF family adenylyltransferase [Blastocatellia bacterium]